MANYKAKQNQGCDENEVVKAIEFLGTVIDVLPQTNFRVKLDECESIVLVSISGKLRMNKIRILLGDRVRLSVSPYDLSRGRIISRL